MKVWLTLADPTAEGGHHRGGQYRSLVYYTNAEQEAQATKILEQVQAQTHRPIRSEVGMAPKFWRAEEYHQKYYAKHKTNACSF